MHGTSCSSSSIFLTSLERSPLDLKIYENKLIFFNIIIDENKLIFFNIEHGRHLDHQIISDYLVEYRSQPRAFKETIYFPHFIQLKEEKRPCSKRVKGNSFMLYTFDLSSTAITWVRDLEEFFLLHPVAGK